MIWQKVVDLGLSPHSVTESSVSESSVSDVSVQSQVYQYSVSHFWTILMEDPVQMYVTVPNDYVYCVNHLTFLLVVLKVIVGNM